MSSPRFVSHVIRDVVDGHRSCKAKTEEVNCVEYVQYSRFCSIVQVYFGKHLMRRCSGGYTCLISGLKVQDVCVCQ